jgi:signal transduction histidine kinase
MYTTNALRNGTERCARSGHPLEVIAFFRRFAPSLLRDLVYTFIWNMGFVLVFTILSLLFDRSTPFLRALWVNFVVANCIGYTIHLAFRAGNGLWGAALHRLSFALRTLYYLGVSVAGVFAGYWIGFTLLSLGNARRWVFSPQGAISVLLLSLLISMFLATMFYARERQAKAEADFERERARGEAAERHAKVAQLKLLEAQVEPHFLYNTLANVISLIDSQPATAKHMIERLIDYLRRAAGAGAAEATLGTQLALLRAYLDLIVLRMGARLAYRIDVPDDLMLLPLPPMLLQPLVENAIKHGLEPKVEGGGLLVSARRDGDRLRLGVRDDGLGVRTTRSTASTGLGLANLRDRLAALYGARAWMTLEDLAPGTQVTIELPLAAA